MTSVSQAQRIWMGQPSGLSLCHTEALIGAFPAEGRGGYPGVTVPAMGGSSDRAPLASSR
jgi:hypothetical protein